MKEALATTLAKLRVFFARVCVLRILVQTEIGVDLVSQLPR